jgi:RNA polymerase sigma-70 factor, ECF subfamily
MEKLTKDNELSDEQIISEVSLKPWLFSHLVSRYEEAFLRKVKGIIYDERDVEEVVLDAFTKIYVNAKSFSPQAGAKFSSWAYRILLNTAFTRYNKLMKERERTDLINPEFEDEVRSEENLLGDTELSDGVERILARLPRHFSYVLRLHYLERWSHEDIANKTGEKVGTIKARIHRAKAAFRKESRPGEVESLS